MKPLQFGPGFIRYYVFAAIATRVQKDPYKSKDVRASSNSKWNKSGDKKQIKEK
jgi:hypothetical protein